MDQNPDQILQRLEELRQWQQQQQLALHNKQVAQRDMLNQEQNKLYEMFGISMSSTIPSESDASMSVYEQSQIHPELLREIINEGVETKLPNPLVERLNASQQADEEPKQRAEPRRSTGRSDRNYEKENVENYEEPVKRTFLKRGQGLQNRFKVDPNALRLDNLPKYKFAGAHKNSKFFKNSVQKIVLKHRQVNQESDDVPVRTSLESRHVSEPITSSPVKVHPESAIPNRGTWGNVLDRPGVSIRGNISIQDTPTREIIRQQQQELDDLDVFEHLEEKMSNMSNHVPPKVQVQTVNSCQSSPDAPRPLNISDPDETIVDELAPGKVRFMSQVRINETSDSETVESSDMDELQINHTSTPNTRSAFRAFKSKLLGTNASVEQSLEDTTIRGDDASVNGNEQLPQMEFIQQQSEQMKTKLAELEREIELFRSHNAALTKAKQQMELDRIQMGEERIEIEERLSDERIKMEVYLHDERMKIVAEKEALDRRSKELRGPNRKEREEVASLKAQVAALDGELAAKEQRHVAAQGRLRAQLRTMEKDLKDYSYDIENLKKENKKLEAENVRLRRQSNNKMLSEINRNIAKLAVVNVPADEPEKSAPKRLLTAPKSTSKVRANSEPRIRANSVPVANNNAESSTESEDEVDRENVTNASNYFSQNKNKSATVMDTNANQMSAKNVVAPSNQDQQQNCKREILNADGSKDILYPNGNIKKISQDTMQIRMLYFNKDIKETNINEGTVKYYYAETNTWHTSYLDGLEILEFPNGQTEHRFKDGRVEVHFPNGSIRITDTNQPELQEEWRYPDGTQVVQMRNGEKVLSLPNGQREIHTELHKRREYPDGTVKLVYPDGSQETRYSNGRIRLKDKSGNLVMDSDSAQPHVQ